MKKLIFATMLVVFALTAWSADNGDYGDEIKLTSSEEYALKKPATRASGKGSAMRENIALQMAADEARASLSQALEMAILAASKNLSFDISQYSAGDEDGQNVYEGGTRNNVFVKTISQNVLSGTPIVKKNKFYKKANKMFTIFVCVEYNGEPSDMADSAVKELKNRISEKDSARIDSELEKWQNEIEKELVKNGGSENIQDDQLEYE